MRRRFLGIIGNANPSVIQSFYAQHIWRATLNEQLVVHEVNIITAVNPCANHKWRNLEEDR